MKTQTLDEQLSIGTRVKLTYGQEQTGVVVEYIQHSQYHQLKTLKYKCQWDDGTLSGLLAASELEVIED